MFRFWSGDSQSRQNRSSFERTALARHAVRNVIASER
jgi:hypothetical protein